jgi:thioredoxin-related protein
MKWVLLLALLASDPVFPQESPEWFVESFLDIREDAAEAAKDGKRLMLYFMQEGCPYCKQLVTVNFRDARIAEKMRRNFMPVTINIWGDREVTTPDGRKMPEKRFAAALKVQFTPTLVFFDGKGALAHRINGYLPPEEFYAALDAAIGTAPVAASTLPASKVDLRRKSGAKPVAVLLLSPGCDACEELERHLKTPEMRTQLARFELVRAANPATAITSKGEQRFSSAYLPALVFFAGDTEVFRTEAYLRPFHLAAAFDYVASGAYAREPSFQRYVQARAERMRSRGERVDLWN